MNGTCILSIWPVKSPDAPDVKLTHAQIQVLQWIANGKDNVEIALLMNIERPQLVQRHVQRVMDMTGTASRSAAVAWALRRKLIR